MLLPPLPLGGTVLTELVRHTLMGHESILRNVVTHDFCLLQNLCMIIKINLIKLQANNLNSLFVLNDQCKPINI